MSEGMALKVIMVGTSPEGKGGIATVVSVMRQDGFFERNQVRYLVTHADGPAWRKLVAAVRACGLLLLAFWRERPAIVHVHAASRASFFRKSVLLALARLCGKRTVFHLHGGAFRQFALQESGPLARCWIRHTLRRSSAVITLSESAASFLRELAPGAQVRVIANAVPVPPAADAATEQAARILFLGRAERSKGIYELLEAVALLRDAYPAIELAIAGDGQLDAVAQVAERLGIAHQVKLLGWINAGQRAAELARAAVFCLPSYDEGLPMSMLEAMAAGKAVLMSAVGGIPEAIVDHGNGLLVPPRDVAALAAALGELLGDPALRQRLARAGRDTVLTCYGTGVVMGKIEAMYSELAGRPGR